MVISEPEGAVLASNGHLTLSNNSPRQTKFSELVSQPADCSILVHPQHQSPRLEVDESATDDVHACNADAANGGQTDTATGVFSTADPQANPASQNGSVPKHAPDKAVENPLCQPSTTADGHPSQEMSKPQESCPPLSSASSSKSDSDSQPSTPASDASHPPAIPNSSQARPNGLEIDQQVAVLSVLAGVAADPASASLQSQDDSGLSAQPGLAALGQPTHTAEDLALASSSASDSSLNIYGALREDTPHGDDWQVVKPNRKGSTGIVKALADRGHDRSAASQQHAVASRARERFVEPQLRAHEAGQDIVHMNGDGAHVIKPVGRSSSQASMSSWASVDTVEGADRYSLWHAKQIAFACLSC